MANERVPLALAAICDGQGVSLEAVILEAIAECEDDIHVYRDRKDGAIPEKPHEITVKLDYKAVGDHTRIVGFKVTTKRPDTGERHAARVLSIDGGLVADVPPTQFSMADRWTDRPVEAPDEE